MRLQVNSGLQSLRLLLLIAAVGESAKNRRIVQKRRLVLILNDIGVCTDKQHQVEIHNLTFGMDEWGGTLATADVVYRKGMKDISKLVVIMTRCTGGKAPSLCEYYTRWVWTAGLCQFVPAKGMIWTPMVKSFTPPFECPVPKGHFHVRNATLDAEAAQMMLPREAYKHIWPVEMHLHDEEGDRVMCFLATVEGRFVKGKGRAVPEA